MKWIILTLFPFFIVGCVTPDQGIYSRGALDGTPPGHVESVGVENIPVGIGYLPASEKPLPKRNSALYSLEEELNRVRAQQRELDPSSLEYMRLESKAKILIQQIHDSQR